MSEAAFSEARRPLQAACAAIVCAALAVFAWQTAGANLWLDELFTLILVRAHSLPKLWAGIVTGIDGNPPLYLTLAWLLAHAVPTSVATSVALKLANIAVTAAAILALYRVSRRFAAPLAAWSGTFLFAALNDSVVFVALELRTYALYFLCAALAVWLQQRLTEFGRTRDTTLLALVYAALALSHTFGIAYVGTIALAGMLSAWPDRRWKLTILAACPAIVAFAAWMPFFVQQSAVGRPYIWFGPPDASALLQGLFSSPIAMWIAIVELYGLASAALWLWRKRPALVLAMFRSARWQPQRYAALLVLGLSGFALTIWIVSVLWFPMFVPRYFTPQLIAGCLLHVAFADLVVAIARRRLTAGRPAFRVLMTLVPPLLLCAVLLSGDSARQQIACADSTGLPFERDFVHGDAPVVAESPHIFLPRATYAPHGEFYRFPLDWDVVINYPDRTRGNATDFHIMQNLKAWAGNTAVMSTDDIIRTLPRFLAIEHSSRAWFHNLRNTRNVVADRLVEVTSPSGGTCTLWNVTSVTARP